MTSKPDTKPAPTFDRQLSLELDKAQAALEEATAAGDTFRAEMARAWIRKLEAAIFGETP